MSGGLCSRRVQMALLKSRTLSISIDCNPKKAYEFILNPVNLPKWAKGLSGSIKKVGEAWIAESPMGSVKVKFADKNKFGILDHDVTLPSGIKVSNPMRVMPNGNGSEIIFTLFQQPDMSDEDYARDIGLVQQDLQNLKTIMESA